jgi:glucose dehydrogenase
VSHLKFLLSLPIALAIAQGLRVESTPYATVTDERLQRPEAGDWLMYRRTYDGSGFSPLQQINTSNVEKLSLKQRSRVMNPKERQTVAYHECGHALVRGMMLFLLTGSPVGTRVRRGRAQSRLRSRRR